MYHYHLVTRIDSELNKKVYIKQKESSIKGDWFRTLQDVFNFIGEEINDDQIASFSKPQYKIYIQDKVKIAAFHAYLALKEKSKKKLKSLEYTVLKIQPYLISDKISSKQIKLLYSLRSKCYSAKMNFKKMHKGDLKCIFHCNAEETQYHIFEHCQPIRLKLNITSGAKLDAIYGTLSEQLEAIQIFEKIDDTMNIIKLNILPGSL
jgi:hypothetical protein